MLEGIAPLKRSVDFFLCDQPSLGAQQQTQMPQITQMDAEERARPHSLFIALPSAKI
jgi:hypothetical protein